MNDESPKKEIVEVIVALAAKIQASIMDGNPEGAERYSGAMRDAAGAYQYVVEVEKEEE